uniref:RBR-type E3 ubiquitin transferase n=1 Tax=Amphora coffeiformis TaxID=265554 RepID=A0A7S3P536_9STRA
MDILYQVGNLVVDQPMRHRGRQPRNNNTAQNLIQENRRQIGERSPVLQDCVATRIEAYEVVGRLMSTFGNQRRHGESIGFQNLICILKCLGNDTHAGVQPALRQTARRFVEVYQLDAQTIVMEYQQARKLMDSLLLPLLNAATSTSDSAREFSVAVAAHVLGQLDPLPAKYLCQFMTRDPVDSVAKLARVSLKKLNGLAPDLARPVNVTYINLSLDSDVQALKQEMENRTAIVACSMDVSSDVAFSLLSKEQFAVAQTISAMQNDFDTYIRDCGVYNRLTKGSNFCNGTDSKEHFCEICYENVSGSQVFALACQHYFCKECWGEAITTAFGDGESTMTSLKCPRHQCPERLTRADLEVLAPNFLEKWNNAAIKEFVLKSSDHSFCPGADCTVVANIASDVTKNYPASCGLCGTSFCFQCGKSPHRPATCDIIKRYEAIMQEFSELEHIMKECPACFVRIQKNGGCNHMTCTHCGHEFCWVCLSPNWSDHSCNIFQELEQQDDANRRARFFSHRVNAHRMSERFAREGIKQLDDTIEDLARKIYVEDEEEAYQCIENGLTVLADARNFLLNSYIAAFGLNRDNVYKHEFETHQAQVELLTERLSQLTESLEGESFKAGEEKVFQARLKSILLTSGALSLYIRRVDLFMSSFMS